MSQNLLVRLATTSILTFVLIAETFAGPARFWISPFPDDPFWSGLDQQGQSDTLEIDLIADPMDQVNSKQRLYIWAQPDSTTAGLKDISLNVVSFNRSGNAVIDFLDGNKIDPNGEEPTLGNPGNSPSRFTSVRDGRTRYPLNEDLELTTLPVNEISVAQPDAIKGLIGENVGVLPDTNMTTEIPRPGLGIGPGCLPGDLACTPHPGVSTPQGDVWRVGALTIQSLQSRTGEVDLHLQIGELGMRHFGGNTADTDVIFSATSATSQVYNAGLGADPNEGRQDTNFATDAPEVRVFISNTLTGDYNQDNVVNGLDYLAWQHALGSGNLPNRRFGVNGPIGRADLSAWQANYGRSIDPPAFATVPEPSSISLCLFLCGLVASLRHHRIELPVKRHKLHICMLVLLCLTVSDYANATTIWWTGDQSGTENGWQNRGNWSITSNGNTNPQNGTTLGSWQNGDLINGNDLVFNHPSFNNTAFVMELDSNPSGAGIIWTPLSLEFASPSTTTIERGDNGSELRPGVGGINITGGGDVVLDALVRIRTSTGQHQWDTGDSSGASLTLLRNLDLRGHTLTITGQGATTINGNIQGEGGVPTAGSLIKRGMGTLTLNGTGNYTGTTKVRNGTLSISQASNISSALLEFDASEAQDGAELQFSSSFTLPNAVTLGSGKNKFRANSGISSTLGGSVGGAGGLTKVGSGTLTLNGNNTYTGATTVSGERWRLAERWIVQVSKSITVGRFDLIIA